VKTPASLVTRSLVALVSSLVTTTAAPGSTAPVLSTTVPVIVAERICADAVPTQAKRANSNTPRRTRWLVVTTTSLVNAPGRFAAKRRCV
jgi:hypothetical protein